MCQRSGTLRMRLLQRPHALWSFQPFRRRRVRLLPLARATSGGPRRRRYSLEPSLRGRNAARNTSERWASRFWAVSSQMCASMLFQRHPSLMQVTCVCAFGMRPVFINESCLSTARHGFLGALFNSRVAFRLRSCLETPCYLRLWTHSTITPLWRAHRHVWAAATPRVTEIRYRGSQAPKKQV